jgi:gamma-tubulin complex component 2
MFAKFTPKLTRQLQIIEQGVQAAGDGGEPDLPKMDYLDDILKKYEENFSHHLKILVDALNYYAAAESVALLGLLSNLDWNKNWNRDAVN